MANNNNNQSTVRFFSCENFNYPKPSEGIRYTISSHIRRIGECKSTKCPCKHLSKGPVQVLILAITGWWGPQSNATGRKTKTTSRENVRICCRIASLAGKELHHIHDHWIEMSDKVQSTDLEDYYNDFSVYARDKGFFPVLARYNPISEEWDVDPADANLVKEKRKAVETFKQANKKQKQQVPEDVANIFFGGMASSESESEAAVEPPKEDEEPKKQEPEPESELDLDLDLDQRMGITKPVDNSSDIEVDKTNGASLLVKLHEIAPQLPQQDVEDAEEEKEMDKTIEKTVLVGEDEPKVADHPSDDAKEDATLDATQLIDIEGLEDEEKPQEVQKPQEEAKPQEVQKPQEEIQNQEEVTNENKSAPTSPEKGAVAQTGQDIVPQDQVSPPVSPEKSSGGMLEEIKAKTERAKKANSGKAKGKSKGKGKGKGRPKKSAEPAKPAKLDEIDELIGEEPTKARTKRRRQI